MDTILFKEQQYMTGGWVLLVVMCIVLVVMLPRYKKLAFIQKVGAIATIAILMVTATIMFTLRLETVYYNNRVEHRFASLFGTDYDVVNIDSVASIHIGTYNPSDYGGWGMKGNETTRAYNASGNQGILFTFRSGRKLLLGTQQPDTLYAKVKDHYPISK